MVQLNLTLFLHYLFICNTYAITLLYTKMIDLRKKNEHWIQNQTYFKRYWEEGNLRYKNLVKQYDLIISNIFEKSSQR